jgi:ferredoxin--NADP+ reductase
MAPLGNPDLRVAVIGLGRSEAHVAGYLLANAKLGLRVDVLETGPAPARDELLAHYQAVIYALGEPADRPLTIPGAELAGCTTATAVRDRLSGHTPASGGDIDLSCRRAVLIGDNDLALGLAGMLARGAEPPSDAEPAEAARSAIEEIVVVGRAGPEQAAFTPGELRALGLPQGIEVVADAAELAVPEPYRELAPDRRTRDNLAVLQEYAGRPRRGDRRRIALRFLLSPTRILGAGRVQAVELARNALERGADGGLHVQATPARATIPAGLVVSAERQPRRPFPSGVPVDPQGDVITDEHGRVTSADGRPTGEYVSEGPAVETVRVLAHDVASGRLSRPA